jgi:TetR/AcrR family transcriptional regulator, transcriptional repressor of aconitase
MPRITQQHEQQVRQRILVAALRVFGEHGFHRATMQDVVRESGLSVGAIYTYFKSKDELFLSICDMTVEETVTALAARLPAGSGVAEKMAIAIGFFLDSVDAFSAMGGGTSFLVHAWAEAESEPSVREMLVRRREQIVTVGRMLLQEGIAHGELPAWIDVDAAATAYSALLDGLTLIGLEEGAGYDRAETERRAVSVLELLLAAAGTPRPDRVRIPSEPFVPAWLAPPAVDRKAS